MKLLGWIQLAQVLLLPLAVTAVKTEGTVYWQQHSDDYRLEKGLIDVGKGAAYGFFDDNVTTSGWGFFASGASDAIPTSAQYKATGMLEGALSYKHIDYYGTNQFTDWGFTPTTVPATLYSFMSDNLAYMRAGPSSPGSLTPQQKAIWAQVGLILMQFDGIVEGYTHAFKHNDYTQEELEQLVHKGKGFGELDLFMLNAAGDMEDLVNVFTDLSDSRKQKQQSFPKDDDMTDCSAAVVMTSSDLMLAHATWRGYTLMNRVYKDVNIGGMRTSFSSSPGFISSKDDFYITTNDLGVYETTNSIFNSSLYDLLKPECLLTWVRSTVANTLATGGDQWTSMFAEYNSGTYNNQFGVIDFKLFTPDATPPSSDLFWIIEQIPGYSHRGDVTQVLVEKGFWPSYNVPYFKDIYEPSGYPARAEQNPEKFDYDVCARAQIFGRECPLVTSLEGMQRLIRLNDYTLDPLSGGDPSGAVASRYDLRTERMAPFGAVDGKVTSYSLLFPNGNANTFAAAVISGPTAQDKAITPPFSWSQAEGLFMNVSHVGQPDTWDFVWQDMPPQGINWLH